MEIRDLFDHPTVSSLGVSIEDRLIDEIAAMDDEEVERTVSALSLPAWRDDTAFGKF